MKKLSFMLFSFVLIILLAACGSDEDSGGSGESSENGDVIKIGTLHPLTGAQAPEGQEMRDAVQLAVDEVNDNGGIESLDGAKVELIESDSENNPEKGISEVQKMDSGGVVGIVGPYTTAVALAATQEAERAGIPFIVDVGSADEITERGFNFTFRMQPAASSFPESFLEYIPMLNEENDVELNTVVNSHEDSDFGSGMANVLKENASATSIEVLATLSHAADTADLSSDINKIKSLKPDIVSSTTYLSDGQLLSEALKSSGYEPQAVVGMASGAFSNAKFIEEQQEINQHFMDINYATNPNNDMTEEVKDKYKEKFGKGLGPNAALSYTGAVVLLEAIERAGSTDRDDIREEITNTNLEDHILAQEEVKFDETGQNANAQTVVNQIIDGESKVVMPDEYKAADPIYPLP